MGARGPGPGARGRGPGLRGPVSQTASGPGVGRKYRDRGTRSGGWGTILGAGANPEAQDLAREPMYGNWRGLESKAEIYQSSGPLVFIVQSSGSGTKFCAVFI